MARKVFYSFHFQNDYWRTSQVRRIGSLEGNVEISDNAWEEVKKDGDKSIENWIKGQLNGRTCTILLIGSATAGRKWINYEITQSWELKKGLVGIYIHRLLDPQRMPSAKGSNPFDKFNLNGTPLSSIIQAYDPPGIDSKAVYKSISENISALVETAISVRGKYS